jgi:hypothetical protein
MDPNSNRQIGSDGEHIFADQSTNSILKNLLDGSFNKDKRALTPEEWSRLSDIMADCHRLETPFEDSVICLLEAFLLSRYPDTFTEADALRKMSAVIGRSICGDPYAKQRMQEFQQHLIDARRGA